KTADATARFNALSAQIKAAEKRMTEIAVLKTHIINYSKTRDVYTGYKAAGYSKEYLAEHESDIIIHKAAKKAFDTASRINDVCIDAFRAHMEAASLLSRSNNSYEAMKNACDSIAAIPNIRTKGLSEDEKKIIKTLNERLKKDYLTKLKSWFSRSEEQVKDETVQCLEYIATLSRLLKAYAALCTKAKSEREAAEFSDVEHMALRLLEENGSPTALCLRLRAGLEQIYIDEYQDVNPLQDKIFSMLSNDENRFIVGDAKQSIYRFRNAQPEIFTSYVSSARPYSEGMKSGKLYLSENFRSGQYIIDFVNHIFRTKNRKNYPVEEELKYAVNAGTNERVCIMPADGIEDEATLVADRICELVGSFIKRDGTPLRYGDIALLMRAPSTDTECFVREFRKRMIPFSCEQSSDFLYSPEILLMTALLRSIDNPLDDIALAGALCSPVFGFDEADLLRLRRAGTSASLYEALIKSDLRQTGRCFRAVRITREKSHVSTALLKLRRGCDSAFAQKAFSASSKLTRFRNFACSSGCDEVIWYIYMNSGLLGTAATPERANLLRLYEAARSFESSQPHGLSAFVEYYREIYDKKLKDDNNSIPSFSDDRVHIMSIHQSKGLDFPAVFLCRASKKINISDISENYIVSHINGISLRFDDRRLLRKIKPVFFEAAAQEEKSMLAGEEKRLLYVALTRAKELLFVSGDRKFQENSYLADIVCASGLECCRVYERSEERESAATAEEKTDAVNSIGTPENVSFIYPYGQPPRAKISVSELDESGSVLSAGSVNRSVVHTVPSFIHERSSGAQHGTAMHEFMQFASFKNVEVLGVHEEAKRLVELKFITGEQLLLLNIKQLEGFFDSSLYGQIKSSPRVFREKRFSIIENAELLGEKYASQNEKILVQGVIDLFFENPDGSFTVVDYKTDFGDDSEAIAGRHMVQIQYYCRAVREMTRREATRAVVFHFSSGKAIELPPSP
ncbi:MAG TPA: 3'-5' exonuclease, partial [Bacillota bacterium]|nr:3'-5' exonuclease [Bacillota bacterium]